MLKQKLLQRRVKKEISQISWAVELLRFEYKEKSDDESVHWELQRIRRAIRIAREVAHAKVPWKNYRSAYTWLLESELDKGERKMVLPPSLVSIPGGMCAEVALRDAYNALARFEIALVGRWVSRPRRHGGKDYTVPPEAVRLDWSGPVRPPVVVLSGRGPKLLRRPENLPPYVLYRVESNAAEPITIRGRRRRMGRGRRLYPGDRYPYLSIDAPRDADWEISFFDAQSLERFDRGISGKGSGYFVYTGPKGFARFEHDGTGFEGQVPHALLLGEIIEFGTDMCALGRLSMGGSDFVPLPGPAVLKVEAAGSWSIRVEPMTTAMIPVRSSAGLVEGGGGRTELFRYTGPSCTVRAKALSGEFGVVFRQLTDDLRIGHEVGLNGPESRTSEKQEATFTLHQNSLVQIISEDSSWRLEHFGKDLGEGVKIPLAVIEGKGNKVVPIPPELPYDSILEIRQEKPDDVAWRVGLRKLGETVVKGRKKRSSDKGYFKSYELHGEEGRFHFERHSSLNYLSVTSDAVWHLAFYETHDAVLLHRSATGKESEVLLYTGPPAIAKVANSRKGVRIKGYDLRWRELGVLADTVEATFPIKGPMILVVDARWNWSIETHGERRYNPDRDWFIDVTPLGEGDLPVRSFDTFIESANDEVIVYTGPRRELRLRRFTSEKWEDLQVHLLTEDLTRGPCLASVGWDHREASFVLEPGSLLHVVAGGDRWSIGA